MQRLLTQSVQSPLQVAINRTQTLWKTGTDCQVCYSSNLFTSRGQHLSDDTQFNNTQNRNYDARFGTKDSQQNQIRYHVSRHFWPSPRNMYRQGISNYKKNYSRNKQFREYQVAWSSKSYSNLPSSRLANVAPRSGPPPHSNCRHSKNRLMRIRSLWHENTIPTPWQQLYRLLPGTRAKSQKKSRPERKLNEKYRLIPKTKRRVTKIRSRVER